VSQQTAKQNAIAIRTPDVTHAVQAVTAIAMSYTKTGRTVNMSDLQDVIATSSIRAYNMGIKQERERILRIINEHEAETKCKCEGCVSWINAFELLKVEITNAQNL
jgi:SLT domain-containing protein